MRLIRLGLRPKRTLLSECASLSSRVSKKRTGSFIDGAENKLIFTSKVAPQLGIISVRLFDT